MTLQTLSLLAVAISYASGSCSWATLRVSSCYYECEIHSRSPGQTFDQLPSNATVVEGGSVEFTCTVLSNDPSPSRLDAVWAVQVPGRTERLLGINNLSVLELKNVSTAFIGTNFNSPLTIANVTRSLQGTRVRCFFFVGADPTVQPEPYAFLSVLCK